MKVNPSRKISSTCDTKMLADVAEGESVVRKCGEHFRFAPVSGGKADIPEPTLSAKSGHSVFTKEKPRDIARGFVIRAARFQAQ
jgi:hypothetical protein